MRDISFVKFLPIEPKVPFVSARKIAAILSVLAIFASMFFFFTKNLNYGIDFTGGTVLEVDLEEDPSAKLEGIRSSLNSLGMGQVNLQTIDAPGGGETNHDFVLITVPIQDESPENEVALEKSVINALATLEGDNFVVNSQETNAKGYTTIVVSHGDEPLADEIRNKNVEDEPIRSVSDDPKLEEIKGIVSSLGVNSAELRRINDKSVEIRFAQKTKASATVQQLALGYTKLALAKEVGPYYIRGQGVLGSKVSGELRQKGMLAIGMALLMVLSYIWFRFEWQFAVGAVIALFHDILLTIGVFALAQIEFNLSIIAAILTIVGYSLNDTVIVYDRIRENMRKYKKKSMAELINLSINDTLSRTILTSLTTLLALTALYVLGGPGLRGFSFAMIWGVFVGTYSSIFVASPLLLLFKLRNLSDRPEPVEA